MSAENGASTGAGLLLSYFPMEMYGRRMTLADQPPAAALLFQTLLAHGPLTRAEIGRRTGLSPGAITKVATRAGRDTGYHLVSAQRAMHTVAPQLCRAPEAAAWRLTRIRCAGETSGRMRNSQAGCPLTSPIVTAIRTPTQQPNA